MHGEQRVDGLARQVRQPRTGCPARRSPRSQPTRSRSTKVLQFLLESSVATPEAHHANEHTASLLLGDMPIYVALDSADAWANRDIVANSMAVGGSRRRSPAFRRTTSAKTASCGALRFTTGTYHAATGYRWWIQTDCERAIEQFDLVRIDHFRGFEAFWSVPAGAETRHRMAKLGTGARRNDVLRRHGAPRSASLPIVAEDLGDITDEVHALRRRYGIPGMKVLQFEIDREDFDPAEIEAASVCYTATHDNDTTVGWFQGGDQDTRSVETVERPGRRRWR